jgi:PEP-CTERM motif
VFSPAELTTYGSIVPLPISAPTNIPLLSLFSPYPVVTTGQVDFAVLYNSTDSTYSYFYQVENIGAPGDDVMRLLTISNVNHYPVLGSGVMADGLDPVTLFGSTNTFGAYFDQTGNELTVGQTTDRFFFQFSGAPGVSIGLLQNNGQGNGPVVAPVPEPSSLMLLGMGILGLFGLGKKKT